MPMRRPSLSTRPAVFLVLIAGCQNPPPNVSHATPAASASASTSTPPATNPTTPTPTPSANVATPPPSADNEDSAELDLLAGTIDADAPAAPCDFSRNYRGKVGDSPWSVQLTRKDSVLEGFVAYDNGSGELALRGSVRPDGTFVLEESKDGQRGGQFEGRCAADTGILSGSWKLGKTTRSFTLAPRNAKAVGIFERRRVIGKPAEEELWCHWDVRNPAVFGLGDASRAGLINAHLKLKFGGLDEADAEKRVQTCPRGTENHVTGYYSIEMNEQGILSILENGYVYLGPAAHGEFNAAAATISIDVPTGRKLALADIVTSGKAMRPVVKSCMKLVAETLDGGDEWWHERSIQGVPSDKYGDPVEETSKDFDPSSIHDPSFVVLPDGLAVLIRNQATVGAFLEMQGPVIQWGALLRAGVLKANSPIARIWSNVKPLAATEPLCVRFFSPKWNSPLKRKKPAPG